jgi:pimeloyl-ACP methyl ester carboxylesterase
VVRILASDVTLNAVQAGRGPDVVLVHGLGASLAFWYPQIAPTLGRMFRTTAYDLRGHGRSGVPPSGYGVASMAQDLEAILDGFAIPSAHLLGHSFGALIVIDFALRRPDRVRSLVLADPVAWRPRRRRVPGRQAMRRPGWATASGLRVHPADFITEMSDFMAADVVDSALPRTAQARPLRRYPALTGSLGGAVARNRWRHLLATTTLARDVAREIGPQPTMLQLVVAPCLLTYGDRSRYQGYSRALSAALPTSRLFAVPGAGHFHPVQRPELFGAAVCDFLKAAG